MEQIENLQKYKEKGYTGIQNLGNTCFLNSCLQALNHTYELNELLDTINYKRFLKDSLPDSTILKEWNELRQIMWSGNGTVAPNKFVYAVHEISKIKDKEIFTGWTQNDMPEFLLFMIDCMHNSVSRGIHMNIHGKTETNLDILAVKCYDMLKTTYSKEYSEIMDLFFGIYMSEIISNDSSMDIKSCKPESYFILDLPIFYENRIASNLYDCFDFFTIPEFMNGENAWLNEKTNEKENVHKKISFWNFPKILILCLKRFSPDGSIKLENLIDFPIDNFNLSNYVCGYNPSSYLYDLYAVCNHIGGVNGGHYTAFVKHADNKWVHFNDTIIENIDNISQIVTPMAYCLFYRKR